jgi:hypothetical protein
VTAGSPLPVRFASKAAAYLAALAPTTQELVLDVLAIAARAPLHWDAWDPEDIDSQDLRAAAVGTLTVLYLVQRTEPPHLYVLEIIWAG